MAQDLPGFFFDEETGKYFPLHMKNELEKERKTKEKEEFLVAESSANSCVDERDLDRFVRPSPTRNFNQFNQKIDRLDIQEITWNGMMKLSPQDQLWKRFGTARNDVVYQAGNEGRVLFEHVLVSFGDHVIRDFDVHFYRSNYDSWNNVVYTIFEEENGVHLIHLSGNAPSLVEEIYYNPSRDSVLPVDVGLIFFAIQDGGKRVIKLANLLQGRIYNLRQERENEEFDFGVFLNGLGAVLALRGGRIMNFNNNFFGIRFDIKLPESSATWMHFHNGNLYVITYHGKLIRVNMDDRDKFEDLVDMKSLFESPNRCFEELSFQGSENILAIGYVGSKEISFFNLEDCQVLKRIQLKKPFSQFKFCWSNLTLYTQVKEINK